MEEVRKKEERKKRNKKLTILLVVLLIGCLGYIIYEKLVIPEMQKIELRAYELGINEIILEQTRTGNMYYYDGANITYEPLEQLCERLN